MLEKLKGASDNQKSNYYDESQIKEPKQTDEIKQEGRSNRKWNWKYNSKNIQNSRNNRKTINSNRTIWSRLVYCYNKNAKCK